MKKLVLLVIVVESVAASLCFAQLRIEDCQAKALANYPLAGRAASIDMAERSDRWAAASGYLPRLSASAKSTWQSDAVSVSLPAPLNATISMDRDQYQAAAELDQVVFDGGAIRARLTLAAASAGVERQKLAVDLYPLKDRVNQLFFGILLVDEQLKLNDLLRSELATDHDRVQAMLANGVASQSDLDTMTVTQLSASQQQIELESSRKVLAESLAALIGEPVEATAHLVLPGVARPAAAAGGHAAGAAGTIGCARPELSLFAAQERLNAGQRGLLDASLMPRLGVFVQGGYGKPGLNTFKAGADWFYVAGVRLTWSLDGLYTRQADLERLDANDRSIRTQEAAFLFENDRRIAEQEAAVDRLTALMAEDDRVIALRDQIKHATEEKYRNGTVTVSDLLRDVTAESSAVQQRALHNVQRMAAASAIAILRNDGR